MERAPHDGVPLLPSALWRVTPGPRNRSDACDRPRADRVHYQARAPRRGAAARPMIVPGQRHPFKRPVSGRNPEESPAAFGPGFSAEFLLLQWT